ncbi:hypothetical protein VP501E541_P0162 [Vibrio phage 501E54-1]|nr:hypothetical protein VP501E541_P0162 [Vibrio phage 501E54-1]
MVKTFWGLEISGEISGRVIGDVVIGEYYCCREIRKLRLSCLTQPHVPL